MSEASIFFEYLSQKVTEHIRALLEEKHLYQILHLEFPSFSEIRGHLLKEFAIDIFKEENYSTFNSYYNRVNKINWDFMPFFYDDGKPYIGFQTGSDKIKVAYWAPSTIQRYCKNCDRSHAYNLNYAFKISEFVHEIEPKTKQTETPLILLQYLCQSCKINAETFIINFEDSKLSIHGRSPMETVQVPNVIPKKNRKYFSDSEIAFNSGQILAAKFLLRTYIEQFLRVNTDNYESTDIEQLSKEYNKSLNPNFVGSFPSLYSIYDSLSTDIHKADETEQGFIDAKEKIELHFEGKAAFDKVK